MASFVMSTLTMDSSLCCIVFTLFVLCAYWFCNCSRGLPPGPRGLPIVGYLPFLGYRAHLKFRKLGSEYGNIFSFYLANQLVVVLNDYDAINEALGKNADAFTGRPHALIFDFTKNIRMSLFTADGDLWKEQRRFTLRSLRDLGMGKTGHEQNLLDEILRCCDVLRKGGDHEPIDVSTPVGLSAANIMCLILLGRRYDYHDDLMLRFKDATNLAAHRNDSVSYSVLFPWIMSIPFVNRLVDPRSVLKPVFIQSEKDNLALVEDYKKSASEPHRDNYMHLFLTEKNNRERKNLSDELFTDTMLAQNLTTLFFAGAENINVTVDWGIIYLLNHPEVQLKLQQEIDAKIGFEREPSWNDRMQTPYLEATIWEILRLSSVSPLSVSLRNTVDVKLNGYLIPKDTLILPNLWNVHHDPKLWTNPDRFEPERFMTESGERIKLPDHLMPFSKGKHQCLGETLARTELYLYFATLMQQFTFVLPPGCSPPSMEPRPGPNILLHPQPYKVCCVSRRNEKYGKLINPDISPNQNERSF